MKGKTYDEDGAKEGTSKTSPRKRPAGRSKPKDSEQNLPTSGGRIAYELRKADMVSLKKINPEDWNNIPIPICVALETY